MSTEIALFERQLPAHLRGADAAAINAGAAAGTGGGVSINKLGIKGSKWRLVEGGDEVKVFEKNALALVIVRANDHVTKTFYANPWKPGQEPEAPDCSSDDGITPRADSKNKQCDNCAGCPNNEWGSYINPQTGKKGKKCGDSKRIAVAPRNRLEDGKLYQLQIPAASLKGFGSLINQLNSVNPPVPYNAVVVEFSFDTDQTFPLIKFRPLDYLTEEEYAHAQARYDSQEARDTAGVPGGKLPAAGLKPVKEPEPERIPVQQVEDDDDGFDEPAAPAAKVKAKPAPQPAAVEDDDDGFGDPAPKKAEAAPKKARTRKEKPAEEAEPVTIEHDTGAVAGGDADLDSVFGSDWD
jgi:hypothetical protein